jgi:hypothetical protein
MKNYVNKSVCCRNDILSKQKFLNAVDLVDGKHKCVYYKFVHDFVTNLCAYLLEYVWYLM